MADRLDIGDGDSLPMTIAAIQPGDYIRSKLASHIMGRVVRRIIMTRYPAFLIENHRGVLGVVLECDTMILGFVDCTPKEDNNGLLGSRSACGST